MRNFGICLYKKAIAVVTAVIMTASMAMVPSIEASAANASNAIAWGIDVSKHNQGVDWAAVAATGCKFTFIKAGSTNKGKDPYFDANITGATAAGLKVGVYLYSYAGSADAARAEANQLLQWIAPYTVSFPVVYDVENAAQAKMNTAQINELINAFCSTISAAGYYPLVYSNKNWFVNKIGPTGYDKWVAQYNDHLEYEGATFWQSSCYGKVSGVPTRVDINYQFKDYSSIIIPDGFSDRDGGTRFYLGYKMQRGWIDWAETRFHIDDAGFVQKNMWFQDESGLYYLQGDGSIARGQVCLEENNYYFDGTGNRLTGWVNLENGKFYYAPDTGVMVKGWFGDQTGTYFLSGDTGAALIGCQTIEGQNYYFDANGVRIGGWVTLENGTFYYAPDTGIMVHGWVDDAAGRHYMSTKDGHMLVSDVTIEGKNYYFGDNGVMAVGLVSKPDGHVYYYGADGAMVVSTQVVLNGHTYDINAKGIVTEVVAQPAAQ